MKAHEKTHETFRHQKFCQGPKVGGDQVWAYNGGNVRDNPAMPPTANWKVQNVRQSAGSQRKSHLQHFRIHKVHLLISDATGRKPHMELLQSYKLWRGIPMNLRQLNGFEFGWSSLCIRTCHVHLSISIRFSSLRTSPNFNFPNFTYLCILLPTVVWKVPWDGKVDDRLRIGPAGREGGNPSCELKRVEPVIQKTFKHQIWWWKKRDVKRMCTFFSVNLYSLNVYLLIDIFTILERNSEDLRTSRNISGLQTCRFLQTLVCSKSFKSCVDGCEVHMPKGRGSLDDL